MGQVIIMTDDVSMIFKRQLGRFVNDEAIATEIRLTGLVSRTHY
jgi:hypothetical protein